jgi:hypothetical protein
MNHYNAAMQAFIDRAAMPPEIFNLPIDDRGFPVPWFVEWIDGKPDFRVIGRGKIQNAWKFKRCWICGGTRGVYASYVIGPMCAVNRTISEPGSHHACATFAAIACPFLAKPAMKRNEKDLPEVRKDAAGLGIKRNPGATAVWTSRYGKPFAVPPGVPGAQGGVLFDIGEPSKVEWYANGRTATRAEVEHSIKTGLPLLEDTIMMEKPERQEAAREHLKQSLFRASAWLPAA